MFKEVMNDLWLARISSLSNEVGVKPGQRVTEESHQPWVAISKSGTVLTGHCTCMAGYVFMDLYWVSLKYISTII